MILDALFVNVFANGLVSDYNELFNREGDTKYDTAMCHLSPLV